MIALLQAYKSHLLKPANWPTNIIAGSIVGIVALPLSMAFAIASGTTPEAGIYTAIIAGIIVGIFGGTQVQIAGPTGAFVVILSSITMHHGFAGLQIASMMAGILLIILGLIQSGNIIKYIPYPVIVGFTTGIGIIIFIGQWKSFFGLPVNIPTTLPIHKQLPLLLQALPSLHIATTILSVSCLLIYIACKRWIQAIPAALMVMLGAMILQIFFYTDSIATIGSIFGPIPQKLPQLQFPDFTSVNLFYLIKPACAIAILGAIESLLSATAIDVIMNSKHDSNQELFGQGLANIIAPLFGGFASTGAIARSIKNARSGANCPIAAIVHSITLLCILVMFAPYASFIPLSALAAILFVIAFNMSEPAQFIQFLRLAPWYDIIVLLVTFLLTIFTDLVIAVIGGCMAALFFFFIRLYQTCDSAFIPSKHLDMATYDPTSSKTNENSNRFGLKTLTFWANLAKPQVTLAHCENTVTCHLQGPLFFGIADKLQQALNFSDTEPNCIIFDFSKVPFVDMTGLLMFAKIINRYQNKGIQWYIAHANPVVSKKLQAIGMYQINTIEE